MSQTPVSTRSPRPDSQPPAVTAVRTDGTSHSSANGRSDPERDPGPNLATVGEAAGYLRIDQRSLRRWIAAGEVQVVRFGRAVRVPWLELHRLATAGIPGRPASGPPTI